MDREQTEQIVGDFVEKIAEAAAALAAGGYEELAQELVDAARDFAHHMEGLRVELEGLLARVERGE